MSQRTSGRTLTSASSSRRFPPELVSARDARRYLRAFLTDHGREGELVDAAELALSEVVTNALLHAHTSFEVTLTLAPEGVLRVEVSDGNPQMPVQRDHAEQATTGRGMALVAAYTHDCGVDALGADGKTVWFVVLAGGGNPGEQSEQDLLDAWDIDLGGAADPAGSDTVVAFLGLPPTLWLAAREHHDAIVRELALWAAEHPGRAPGADRMALADQARACISTQVVAELERLAASAAEPHRGLPEGHPSPMPDAPLSLDVNVRIPADAATAFGALQDVLDMAENLALRGLLLARPALPEIVALRDWCCEQAISQQAGVPASPWPGTAQERFTREIRDRHAPTPPAWDARTVADSDRGAIAADDANRIIAISRPLAHALGWAVEDLVGRRVVAVIPPELREPHVAGFTRHLTTGETHVLGVPLTLPVLRADGTRLDCRFLIEQTPASTGRGVYVAWIEPLSWTPEPAEPQPRRLTATSCAAVRPGPTPACRHL